MCKKIFEQKRKTFYCVFWQKLQKSMCSRKKPPNPQFLRAFLCPLFFSLYAVSKPLIFFDDYLLMLKLPNTNIVLVNQLKYTFLFFNISKIEFILN